MAKPPRIPPMHGRSLDDIMRERSVPPDLVYDPDNPMEVNACCGHSTEHNKNCDGNCDKLIMDEYDINIENERRAWARAGMTMENYSTNQLRVDVQIQTIIKVLEQKFGITETDFNEVFKPLMYEHMKNTREQFQDQLEAARLRSTIALPDGPIN